MAKLEIDIYANDKTSGALGGIKKALGNVFATAAGFLGAQVFARAADEVVSFAKDSIGAASDLNETLSKTSEIFGDSADSIIKWSNSAASSLGLSQAAALDAGSGFAIFGKAAGVAGEDLVKFSEDNLQLAADMASFFNTSVEEAAGAIQSAFRGETEPIRRYGVLLDDAAMRAKALELGIISTTKDALTPQQKVLAANALIFEQTADAQGDFAKTSMGYANQQRIFAAQIENAKASLGQAFLPVLTRVMSFLNTQGIPAIQNLITWVSSLKDTFADTTKFQGIRDFFGFLQRWWAVYGVGIQEAAQSIFEALGTAFETAKEKAEPFITEILDKLKLWFAENGTLIEDFAKVSAEFITNNLIPAFVAMWGIVEPILSGMIDYILNIGKFWMQVATGDFTGAWQTMKEAVAVFGLDIYTSVMGLFDTIAALLGTSMEEIRGVWKSNWDMLKLIVSTVFTGAVDIIKQKIDAVRTSFNNIRDTITTLIRKVSDLAAAFINLVVPEIFRPGSPTPFEIGLRGINQQLSKMEMPNLGTQQASMSGAGAFASSGYNVSLVYSPAVSLASKAEAETVLLPYIRNALRKS